MLGWLLASSVGFDLIYGQILYMVSLASRSGYTPVTEVVTGSLRPGEREKWRLEVPSQEEYFVFGACDNYCLDLDLRVYDQLGQQLLGQDQQPDPYPMVTVKDVAGEQKRALTIEVVMRDCRRSTCSYGLLIMGRSGDTPQP